MGGGGVTEGLSIDPALLPAKSLVKLLLKSIMARLGQ